ncbi:hypothetical protein SISSUDRAFT_1044516 [Sistotremastrum suecicum HHB10207 ss-3]|uniref:Uncharacterized protein n=1 Tax=Sistotremastrum suecicum HHB10207 ss-3 TaxID=1314776 RepID=A0A166F4J2_9AGAM|nr:hypothetical protein SISSUDRAFT_1044516 [Sistotremastrum suecicum HHB10207 ss-3]
MSALCALINVSHGCRPALVARAKFRPATFELSNVVKAGAESRMKESREPTSGIPVRQLAPRPTNHESARARGPGTLASRAGIVWTGAERYKNGIVEPLPTLNAATTPDSADPTPQHPIG